tara:strand:+ start:2030 stop:2491 length:462 start_codon:yes stop_codon:yes gene_type:complete
MKKSHSFLGSIENGELKLYNVNLFKEIVRQSNDAKIELVLKVVVDKRTTEQNSYYWGALIAPIKQGLKDLWGEEVSLQETHDLLRNRFCSSERWNDKTAEYIKIPKSTTELSTVEFSEYCEKCRLFALEELSIDIEEYDNLYFPRIGSLKNGL